MRLVVRPPHGGVRTGQWGSPEIGSKYIGKWVPFRAPTISWGLPAISPLEAHPPGGTATEISTESTGGVAAGQTRTESRECKSAQSADSPTAATGFGQRRGESRAPGPPSSTPAMPRSARRLSDLC